MTLQVAKFLESPVTVHAFKRTVFYINCTPFFHSNQKSFDFAIFTPFNYICNRRAIYIILFNPVLTVACTVFLIYVFGRNITLAFSVFEAVSFLSMQCIQ